MALMNCPECGKEVSDKAVSCPGCGYGMVAAQEKADIAIKKAEKEKSREKIIPAIIIAVLVIAVGFGIWYMPWGEEIEAISCAQELKDRMKSPDSFTLKSVDVSYAGADKKQIFKFTYSAQNSYGAAITEIYYAGWGERVNSQDDMAETYLFGVKETLNTAKINMHLK